MALFYNLFIKKYKYYEITIIYNIFFYKKIKIYKKSAIFKTIMGVDIMTTDKSIKNR